MVIVVSDLSALNRELQSAQDVGLRCAGYID